MTIAKAVEWLIKIQRKHGDVQVYFDCPHCKQAFSPGSIAIEAVVVNGEKKS